MKAFSSMLPRMCVALNTWSFHLVFVAAACHSIKACPRGCWGGIAKASRRTCSLVPPSRGFVMHRSYHPEKTPRSEKRNRQTSPYNTSPYNISHNEAVSCIWSNLGNKTCLVFVKSSILNCLVQQSILMYECASTEFKHLANCFEPQV